MNIESSSSANCSMTSQSPCVKAKQIQEKLPQGIKKNIKFKIKYKGKLRNESNFKIGESVEVTNEDERFKGVWFVAIIIDIIGKDQFMVKYRDLITEDDTQLLKEEINAKYIRPCPPEVPVNGSFKMLQEVDAWYNGGWWEGMIVELMSNNECLVRFMNNEVLCFESSQLRCHQDWIDGKWIIPFKESNELIKKFGTKYILKYSNQSDDARKYEYATKTTRRKVGLNFFKGEKVEIRSDEKGYEGSWYTATVINYLKNNNYLVEYLTLKTNDLSEQLREEVHISDIRPYPPDIDHFCQFVPHERVDVWYNDGWWEGEVSSVVHCSKGNAKYSVYFETTNEELEFERCDMRPHQELIRGRWMLDSLACF